MARVQYLGITNPRAEFTALEPYREVLIQMQIRCRPFSADYLVLMAAKDALDTAAFHFTRDPTFFASKPEQSRWRRDGDPPR